MAAACGHACWCHACMCSAAAVPNHQLAAPCGLLQLRVFHNNAGAAPEWFLESVRVRPQQGGDSRWTVFRCGRWLAVNEDDGWAGRG